MDIPKINLQDFTYNLPPERIAQYPLSKRDESKLLIHKDQKNSTGIFKNIPEYLPANSLIIFNETRVVQARLLFSKDTGARIEIFCLEPIEPTKEIQQAFELGSGVIWKCLVGNSKKWKEGKLDHTFDIDGRSCTIHASRVRKEDEYSYIEFTWDPSDLSFSEILQHAGIMPLPPYMKRASEDADKKRYQTIYARQEGSVAAPTAGLHFTDAVFSELDNKGIKKSKVTLHVGAGTFKPVTSTSIADHEMHTEEIHVTRDTLEKIKQSTDRKIIAVGTTTLRTLESIYWFGLKLKVKGFDFTQLDIQQWDPYQPEFQINLSLTESVDTILHWMEQKNMDLLSGYTQLIILPGYTIKTADLLITNFHMPGSTLLLLVSAFIGEKWQEMYKYALHNDFRFLSYGDSCLLFRHS